LCDLIYEREYFWTCNSYCLSSKYLSYTELQLFLYKQFSIWTDNNYTKNNNDNNDNNDSKKGKDAKNNNYAKEDDDYFD